MEQDIVLLAEFNLLLEKTDRSTEDHSQVKSLKDSVEALTTKYQDFNSVLNKVANQNWYSQFRFIPPEAANRSEAIALSTNTFVDLCMQASSSCATLEDIACHLGPAMLLDLSTRTVENGLLTGEAYFAAEVIVTALENILKHKHSRELFKGIVKLCKNTDVSLDVLWLVMSRSWMGMEQYLLIISSSEDAVEKFAECLAKAAGSPCNNIQRTPQMLSDFFGALVVIRFCDEASIPDGNHKHLKAVAGVILDTVVKQLLDTSDAACSDGRLNIYEIVADSCFIELEMLQKFYTQQTVLILTQTPIHAVTEVFGGHSKWSYSKTPSFINKIFIQLLKPFRAVQAKELLQRIVERSEVNWEYVLMFISHIVVLYSEGSQLLQDLVRFLLDQAFQCFEMERLITAFLIARHAGLERSHLFPSYADWFHSVFSNLSSSPANNKKGFTFLMKFLTDVVPVEPSMCLKVHVLHPPAVPSKCRSLLSEYVLLAKLRLEDLKESIEDVGLYGSPNDRETNEVKQKLLLQAQSDVEKAIQAYEKFGKIPGTIIEASIFRKPYYIGHFLPTLLTPRPLPDPPDLKMKFILDLKRAGKIPSSLYQDYETSCTTEMGHHMEGLRVQ